MFFLNEKLIAAFLSICAFFIAMIASFAYKIGLQAALLRSLIAAFIFMFVGLIFGNAIKTLIVEAFAAKEKDDAAQNAQKPAEGGIPPAGGENTQSGPPLQ